MNTDRLVTMANQMATYFRSYPEPEATTNIRKHIKAFWTPRMCEALLADQANAALDPLVTKALAGWKTEAPALVPASG